MFSHLSFKDAEAVVLAEMVRLDILLLLSIRNRRMRRLINLIEAYEHS